MYKRSLIPAKEDSGHDFWFIPIFLFEGRIFILYITSKIMLSTENRKIRFIEYRSFRAYLMKEIDLIPINYNNNDTGRDFL